MGFHGLDPLFFMGSLALFHGPAFRFDGWAPEFTLKWKTTGSHRSKQKNKSAQLANPTFSQHFPIQVSPHYIQLDPIYYDKSSIITLWLYWNTTIKLMKIEFHQEFMNFSCFTFLVTLLCMVEEKCHYFMLI